MARVDQKPGRRRAVKEPRFRRRRPDPVDAKPAPTRTVRVAAPPSPAAPGREQSRARGVRAAVVSFLWFVLVVAATGALVLPLTPVTVPTWLPTAGAVTITTTYAFGLAARTGGRPWVSGGLALALSLAAVVSQTPILLAGAAMSTAVLAAVLGVMATKPAARFPGVVRECVIAILLAAIGALAVDGYHAVVSLERAGYLALGLSLLAATGLVYRLGAGLHGLGRRGAVMVVSGIALLFVSLAYTEALTRWGSAGLVTNLEQTVDDLRVAMGGFPRPIEALVGFPALAWGISTRARRRQGWWVAAFGAAGLAVVAVSLLDPAVSMVEAGLTLAYSAALGLALGYVVIRIDTFLSGARGRRARRLEEATAHRPEPGRTQPLL